MTYDFRYCKEPHTTALYIGSIIVFFAVWLLCEYIMLNIIPHETPTVMAPVMLALVIVGLFVTFFFAQLFTAKFTDRKGAAVFGQSEATLVFGDKTVKMTYDEITDIAYSKAVADDEFKGNSDWSFLPKGNLCVTLGNRRVKIHGSWEEAWEMKKKFGIWKYFKNAEPLDVSLWRVTKELSNRSVKRIFLRKTAESPS
ncbi:MAG: hypothetical protein LBD04_12310 [Synergistaceae bacterium]|jgi:hypothetical protein|nr:hypothetical protein [Synergistaceae bacterium]